MHVSRDQADVAIEDVHDLVRGDRGQLVVVESLDQSAGEDQHRVFAPSPAASDAVTP